MTHDKVECALIYVSSLLPVAASIWGLRQHCLVYLLRHIKADLLNCMMEEYQRLGRHLDTNPLSPSEALATVTQYFAGGRQGPIPGSSPSAALLMPASSNAGMTIVAPTGPPPCTGTVYHTVTMDAATQQWFVVRHGSDGAPLGQVPLPEPTQGFYVLVPQKRARLASPCASGQWWRAGAGV